MNAKILVVILILICLGLGAGWWWQYDQAQKERENNLAEIAHLSNQWTEATAQRDQLRQVQSELESNLLERAQEVASFSNNVNQLTVNLEDVESKAETAAKAAKAEMAKRDAKIAELESQRDDLTQRMTSLNESITGLEGQIQETQRKLEVAEGDREFLLEQLKRLQAEKAELERQFNDLATLREQVRRLREELTVAKRLDWLRRGIFGSSLKGAERLQQVFEPELPEPEPDFGLEVELQQDGGARIVPPPASTNAPNQTNETSGNQ